jgi:CheY-like chemotaxis protein
MFGSHARSRANPEEVTVRLRILASPPDTLAGISPQYFEVGGVYEIRSHVACVYLAKGWAETVADAAAPSVLPLVPEAVVQLTSLVLVFEDEASLRRLAGQLRAYRGYRTAETRHGEEAIERLRERTRGVVVLDLMTPTVTDCRLCVEELYLTDTRVAAIPILLRAAYDEAMVAARRVEAMVVIKTPFDPDALLQALA